jgi:hypothetical protein
VETVKAQIRICAVACLLLTVGAAGARAADTVQASFIEGVWATEDGCKKQVAIDAGGDRNVETVPETLTADGYKMWEGSCTFTSIAKTGNGTWTVKTACGEEAEEWEATETWTLDPTGARLDVTVDGKTTQFVRCDGGKGK